MLKCNWIICRQFLLDTFLRFELPLLHIYAFIWLSVISELRSVDKKVLLINLASVKVPILYMKVNPLKLKNRPGNGTGFFSISINSCFMKTLTLRISDFFVKRWGWLNMSQTNLIDYQLHAALSVNSEKNCFFFFKSQIGNLKSGFFQHE